MLNFSPDKLWTSFLDTKSIARLNSDVIAEFTGHTSPADDGGSLLDSSRYLWRLDNKDRHISTTAKQKTNQRYCTNKRSNVSPAALFLKGKEVR